MMNGILVVDKPVEWTSHDVVARCRRLLKTKRIGHTGTLDPFATGVLVLMIGRATRLAQYLSSDEKEYEATIRFGYRTTTGDVTGERVGEKETLNFETLSVKRIEAAMREMTGVQMQMPPMYSAKKIDGVKMYELARKGIEVERKAVEIEVREFELVDEEEDLNRRDAESAEEAQRFFKINEDGTVDVRVRVVCSSGTYVRVLAEDLGARLGLGAHLSALRRTRAGEFDLSCAVTLEALQGLSERDESISEILPMRLALSKLASVHLNAEALARVRHGRAVMFERESLGDGETVRLLDEAGELIALGRYDAERGTVQPRVLLVEVN